MRRIGSTLVMAMLVLLQPVVVAGPSLAAAVRGPSGSGTSHPANVTEQAR